ncbi:MAG: sigma-70 factor domain-containing protein, partial [Planctomycetota bacterium]
MFEPLIDHDHEEGAVATDVAPELSTKISDDEDAIRATVAADAVAGAQDDTDGEGLLEDENESWSDDPVRMYLTQMGEIPLLTRKEEITLARRIEQTRTAFRRKLLACDFVARQAFKVLERVHRGELPFDRTVQVSVTDR